MNSLLVVGSLHWDIVVNAPHIPGYDETVSGHSVNYVFGGKGGNQAVAADQNGARTYFAGRIGKDQFGAQILERLRDTSINVEGLQQGSGASGMSVAIKLSRQIKTGQGHILQDGLAKISLVRRF